MSQHPQSKKFLPYIQLNLASFSLKRLFLAPLKVGKTLSSLFILLNVIQTPCSDSISTEDLWSCLNNTVKGKKRLIKAICNSKLMLNGMQLTLAEEERRVAPKGTWWCRNEEDLCSSYRCLFCGEKQIRENLDFIVVSRSEQAQRSSRSVDWQIPFYLATQWSMVLVLKPQMAWPWFSFMLAKLWMGIGGITKKHLSVHFFCYSLSSVS